MKKQLYLVIAAAALALSVPFFGQETLGRQSFGVSGTFAPDSSHILIGISEQRRTWTAGLEYCFTLKSTPSLRIDYEASVIPFFQERDPTITGAFAYLNGYQYPVPA